MNIKQAIEKRILEKIEPDEKLVTKEFSESDYDIESSERAFEDEDFKWCIVKCYYSMFHSARAVLFKLGFKERRHFAINVVLEDLNNKGKLETVYINDFRAAVSAREDADYHYSYSKESAQYLLDIRRIQQ
ncbi:HEPN domain-containing protein [Candidatus Woesearchaeota archaeon]|nr:HEPN domain-containing protein [Candidatus Woesearchaeota archaeon]